MNCRIFTRVLFLACLTAGCGEASADAAWRFRFAEPSLAARAQVVETEIRSGGCDGESAFVTQVSPTRSGEAAPKLSPGRYGFYGRARDENCQWYAEGCAEADLPHQGAIEIVLDRTMFPSADPTCSASDAGGTLLDAGSASGGDSSSGSGDSAGSDASNGGDVDAAVLNPFDPAAAKCSDREASVVACFDFNGNLVNAANSSDEPASAGPLVYEPAISGQAIRVGGQRLALADQAQLNLSVFTIELWLRPDALVNLADETNGISLLIDKDRQYSVGFTADGSLRMQVYRDAGSPEDTTAEAAKVSVGQFSYVTFVYNGVRNILYKDGRRIESEPIGIELARGNGSALHIGSGSPDTTRPFDGLIDALRISNVARTDTQICAAAGKTFSAGTCQ